MIRSLPSSGTAVWVAVGALEEPDVEVGQRTLELAGQEDSRHPATLPAPTPEFLKIK